ncbi:hypothetical protein FACS1894211_13380 [Clostridia bacterium]|nr:hypothetical protein FACS1894211_13380 [Clostridia bacterium]
MYANEFYSLTFQNGTLVYRLKEGRAFPIGMPVFELDGKPVSAAFEMAETETRRLRNGLYETAFVGRGPRGLTLTALARGSAHSPVVRFCYVLSGDKTVSMTKRNGADNLTFLSYKPRPSARLTEVRLSDYDHAAHSFMPCEVPAFEHEDRAMGPILTEEGKGYAALLAYEHGSLYPDRFLSFRKEGGRITLCAEKGSYYDGRPVGGGKEYRTVWLQFCAVPGSAEELSARYREFVFKYFSENTESRKPYIYYNTWNFQERNKFRNGKAYLDSMNYDRILREIDAAHAMGIDVFVLDTGWFAATGDWEVHPQRFPDGLRDVRARLDGYGMKLGLWFDPRVAAAGSRVFRECRQYMSTYDEAQSEHKPFAMWESEDNYILCLCSDYWKTFADRLIRLYKECGVRYFKWDAVWQYDCSNGGHGHGTAKNSLDERRQCYAYELVARLNQIAERVQSDCPDAILDLDVTESSRTVGLAFLAVGKFFMINNGPYYREFGVPIPETADQNVFTYPGHARADVCRAPLVYDKWLPSVLTLTHYLPDDPADSQLVNLASLILGQNGIWGDLLGVSAAGTALIAEVLAEYRKVREDITAARIHKYGAAHSGFEVYEKLNPENGRGAVSVFCRTPGIYRYTLSAPAAAAAVSVRGPVTVTRDGPRVALEFRFTVPAAALLIFS